jgi:hypothetical protein
VLDSFLATVLTAFKRGDGWFALLQFWWSAMAQEDPPRLTEISVLALYQMRGGVIHSETIAVKVGTAILEGLYGRDLVDSQEPFRALEDGNRWIVRGSAEDPRFAAVIVLNRLDARVLEIDAPTPLR